MKTYQTAEAQTYHESEEEAFRRLRVDDLGLSHFERHSPDLHNVSTEEKFGTSRYSIHCLGHH